MKNIYWILVLGFLSGIQLHAQNTFRWARGFGGSGSEFIYDMAADAAGNTYICGNFSFNADFDPDSNATFQKSSKGGSDMYICKFDQGGNLIWAQSIGGKSGEMAIGISLDSANNVFVCGYFSDTVDFNPDTMNTAYLISSGRSDVFVLKLGSNGSYINAVSFGSTQDDQGFGLITDKSGHVYVCGIFRDSVDFDPGPAQDLHISNAGTADAFAVKLDNNLGFIKAITWGGNNYDFANSVCMDNHNNPVIAGRFIATVDMNPGSGVDHLISKGGFDGFVLKTDTGLNHVWAKSIGGAGSEYIYSVATDPSGNVLLTGTFNGICDFNPDPNQNHDLKASGFDDVFVCKLDSAGGFNWAHKFGKTSYNYGRDIRCDANGSVYVCGGFRDTVDFNPDSAISQTLISSGNTDAFLLSLNPDGSMRWVKKAGGPGEDLAFAVAISGNKDIYIAGQYFDSCNFHTDSGSFYYMNNGSYDVFLLKLQAPVLNVLKLNLPENVLIYPNPANDRMYIETSENQVAKAELYSLNGIKLADSIFEDGRLSFHTADLEPALYIIKISTENGDLYKKIMVTR